MEGSRRSLKRRNPLSDLTNTHSPSTALPSSHSSSSTASASASKSKPKPKPKPKPPPSFTDVPPLTQRKTTSRTNSTTRPVASSNPSHPPPPNSPFLPVSHGHDVLEPISVVYSRRRRTPDKRKGKEKVVAVPFNSTPMPKVSSSRELNLEVEGLDYHKAKALTAPCRKKRCTMDSKKDVFQHAMPRDFIEKQQAYFKEIDNFELPVEEVESVAELD